MTDKLEDTNMRLKDEMDLYRTILDKLWHNRHEFQKEKESMQEVRSSLLTEEQPGVKGQFRSVQVFETHRRLSLWFS